MRQSPPPSWGVVEPSGTSQSPTTEPPVPRAWGSNSTGVIRHRRERSSSDFEVGGANWLMSIHIPAGLPPRKPDATCRCFQAKRRDNWGRRRKRGKLTGILRMGGRGKKLRTTLGRASTLARRPQNGPVGKILGLVWGRQGPARGARRSGYIVIIEARWHFFFLSSAEPLCGRYQSVRKTGPWRGGSYIVPSRDTQ